VVAGNERERASTQRGGDSNVRHLGSKAMGDLDCEEVSSFQINRINVPDNL
jgi:hypothetical protein